MCVKNIKNMKTMVRFSKYVGSIRIQHILLKTENWKHCSKIIFKCVNSVMRFIFNIFFLNKVVVGPVNSALCLLYSEFMCMNNAVTIHMRGKKKKKKGNLKPKMQTRNKPNPNRHVVMLIFLMEVVVLVYNQIWCQTLLIS